MAITRSTLLSDGTVAESPQQLANEAGVDLETYSLARCIGSEAGGNDGELIRTAIGWVIVNRAIQLKQSIYKVLTFRTNLGYTDTYGKQSQRRFASTARDPSEIDIWVAKRILTGYALDPTNGAQRFIAPRAQQQLSQSTSNHKPFQEVLDRWASEGYFPVPVAGIDQSYLMFLRKGKAPNSSSGVVQAGFIGGGFLFSGAILWAAYTLWKKFSKSSSTNNQ